MEVFSGPRDRKSAGHAKTVAIMQKFPSAFPQVMTERVAPWTVIRLCRTDASNALNEQLLAHISEAVASALNDPESEGICLTGGRECFMIGADLKFFVRCVLAGDLERILQFTRSAHELLEKIAKSAKPIVAWVQGPAYGAGLELALACHKIVAAPTAKCSLPETGLGIYPGMGGTQRAPRRIGSGLAKWMIFTGAVVPAEQALEIGLVDAIHSTAATSALEAMAALEIPKPAAARSARFDLLEELFSKNCVATLLQSDYVAPTDAAAIRALVQLRSKAPLALQRAEEIIDRGASLSLTAGIEEELAHLREIFATEDARAGLLSFGRTTPHFVGR